MKLRHIDFRKSEDIYNDPNRGKAIRLCDITVVACPKCKQPMWGSKKDTKLYVCKNCYEKHLKRLSKADQQEQKTISRKVVTTKPKIHDLKILPEYFDAVRSEAKKFEVRKNDRGFHVGDILHLMEWDGNKFTGRSVTAYVTFILFEWQDAIKPGYCIMSIELQSEDKNEQSFTRCN